MRRSNFIIGFVTSVVVHGAVAILVLLAAPAPAPAPVPAPVPVTPVQIAALDPEERVELEAMAPDPARPEPLPVEHVLRAPGPRAETRPEPLRERAATLREPAAVPEPVREPRPEPVPDRLPERVADRGPEGEPERVPEPPPPTIETLPAIEPPPAAAAMAPVAAPTPRAAPAPGHADRETGSGPPATGDDGVLPPMRVHWRDAAEVRAVARALGMRLVAVNRAGEVIAEINLSSRPGLKAWRGLPYGYSNRVRVLSPSIFASPLTGPGAADISEIWIFVPADRDRAMVTAQRDAIRRAGARAEDVLAVDARFVRAAVGSYRLDITGIRRRGERRGADG